MKLHIAVALALVSSSTGFVSPTTGAGTIKPFGTTSLNAETTSVSRNANFDKLQGGYLFPEIGRRRNAYLEENPSADIISLGIGDTTQPIPPTILKGLQDGVAKLGTQDGYTGYGAEQGAGDLRAAIAENLYEGKISADEVSGCFFVFAYHYRL